MSVLKKAHQESRCDLSLTVPVSAMSDASQFHWGPSSWCADGEWDQTRPSFAWQFSGEPILASKSSQSSASGCTHGRISSRFADSCRLEHLDQSVLIGWLRLSKQNVCLSKYWLCESFLDSSQQEWRICCRLAPKLQGYWREFCLAGPFGSKTSHSIRVAVAPSSQ